MEATSIVHLLLSIDHFIETAKASSLRIAFLFVHFLFILYTVYVVGRALQPMHEFGRMHARETSKFQKGGTIWPMLDFLHVRNFLFHTKAFSLSPCEVGSCKSAVRSLRTSISFVLNSNIQGLRTRRNCLICAIHQHAMQLNVYLVF